MSKYVKLQCFRLFLYEYVADIKHSYLASVFLTAEFELDVRIAEAVLVHWHEVTTLNEADAHHAPPQLRLLVHFRESLALLLLLDSDNKSIRDIDMHTHNMHTQSTQRT